MNKRIFLIVLDSCGIGEAPDAADFGDVGASTIRSISKSKYFNIDTLRSIGYTNIDGLSFLGDGELLSRVARLKEKSRGKDTTIGHWEIAGLISEKFFGQASPEMFAEVETIGRGKRFNSSVQKPCSGILIPTLPSSATTLCANPIAPG